MSDHKNDPTTNVSETEVFSIHSPYQSEKMTERELKRWSRGSSRRDYGAPKPGVDPEKHDGLTKEQRRLKTIRQIAEARKIFKPKDKGSKKRHRKNNAHSPADPQYKNIWG